MKKATALLIAALLMVCVCAPFAAHAAQPTFTILVYLCGTDLETDGMCATADLVEMMCAGLTWEGPITVLVEAGGTRDWALDAMDPEYNERWVIVDGEMFCLDQIPRANMGAPETLQSFIEFGMGYFAADRYALILWDHGGGSTGGICFDEFAEDELTLKEVYTALDGAKQSRGGLRFDFIALDACLMATYEMASHLAPFADYMVASEELSPGVGFNYEPWLTALVKNPAIGTEALLKTLVDESIEAAMEEDPDDYMTLSVINLRGIANLTAELEKIGKGLSAALSGGELGAISRYRQGMRSFGDYERNNTSDMVDLRLFVETYAKLSGADTAAFFRAFDEVIAYNRYTEHNLSDIGGMSILVPLRTRAEFVRYGKEYDAFSLYPRYTEFITAYTELMNGGSYVFSPSAPQQAEPSAITGELAPSGWEDIWDGDAFDEDGFLAYYLELDSEDMENLAYVEGNLMIDISDDEMDAYIDLGYLRDTYIDWEEGVVYSLFDGAWPCLEGQPVSMSDQSVTEYSRRSLIDAFVNGEEQYLLVVFDEKRPYGEVIGYTEGYNANGLPVRGHQKFKDGDVIVPLYSVIYWDEDDEMQIEYVEGDPIVYRGALEFGYVDLTDSELAFAYAFCLNDIFGDYQFSDFVYFVL